jgi:DNA-binding IclR family transcriptional regulator
MATSDSQGSVKTVDRVFAIIKTLDRRGTATLTEIASDLDAPRSTIYAHLSTMTNNGILVKENKQYRLSLEFLKYGMSAKRNHDIADIVQPKLDQMAERTNEIAWFLTEENGKGVYLNKAKGNYAVQPYGQIGEHVHLHDIAAGKAILSQLSERRVHQIIDRHGLPARTDETITDPDTLFAELAEIRERGVAFNDGEAMDSFRAVAAPISTGDQVHGSIVISGPENRLQGKRFTDTIPDIVAGTANALELEIMSEKSV